MRVPSDSLGVKYPGTGNSRPIIVGCLKWLKGFDLFSQNFFADVKLLQLISLRKFSAKFYSRAVRCFHSVIYHLTHYLKFYYKIYQKRSNHFKNYLSRDPAAKTELIQTE